MSILEENMGGGKTRFRVVSMQNTGFIPCIIIYCIIFHTNNHKVTLAPPHISISVDILLKSNPCASLCLEA